MPQLVEFVQARRLAVVATVGAAGEPQAALVGLGATELGELVFDTSMDSRKFGNVTRDGRVAVVVGWEDEVTVQIGGLADVPAGEDRDRCQQAYFVSFPDGQERAAAPEIGYVRVRPRWVRLSDFRPDTFGSWETTFGPMLESEE